jgi:hypothetical protein
MAPPATQLVHVARHQVSQVILVHQVDANLFRSAIHLHALILGTFSRLTVEIFEGIVQRRM